MHPQRKLAPGPQSVDAQYQGTGELDLGRKAKDNVKLSLRINVFGSRRSVLLYAYQLEDCEVPLPPQELGDFGSQDGQAVVRVHEHVDRRVDHGRQEGWGKNENRLIRRHGVLFNTVIFSLRAFLSNIL